MDFLCPKTIVPNTYHNPDVFPDSDAFAADRYNILDTEMHKVTNAHLQKNTFWSWPWLRLPTCNYILVVVVK